MVVRDQHGVNARQVNERNSRRTETLWAAPRDGTRARAPLRIGQDVQAIGLYQESRVADPGNTWVDVAGAQCRTVIGNARRIEAPRRREAGPESARNEAPASPSRGPAKVRVGVAKAA